MKIVDSKRSVLAGIFIASMMGGLFVPSRAEGPKKVTETRYFKDMSAYFYQSLPYLKKGFRFLDSSLSVETKEGIVSSLVIEPADGKNPPFSDKPHSVHVTKDFAPFIDSIGSKKEAFDYALFLSRKGFPWMEPIRFDYFQDIPFIALEFTHVSSTTLTANAIQPPRVAVKKGFFFQKDRYTIVRTVVPLDQPNLKEEIILTGKTPLQLTEVAEVTDTVMEDGSYSFTLRRIPVKDFPIENPLKALRKKS